MHFSDLGFKEPGSQVVAKLRLAANFGYLR